MKLPVVKCIIVLPPGPHRQIAQGHIAIQKLTKAVAHIARCMQRTEEIQLDYEIKVEVAPVETN